MLLWLSLTSGRQFFCVRLHVRFRTFAWSRSAQRAEQLDTGAFGWVVARAVNWSEVIELAHNGIALLLGQDDAVEALRVSTFNWQPPVLLPWGKRRVLVIGGRV
jgi:hypothetical protein